MEYRSQGESLFSGETAQRQVNLLNCVFLYLHTAILRYDTHVSVIELLLDQASLKPPYAKQRQVQVRCLYFFFFNFLIFIFLYAESKIEATLDPHRQKNLFVPIVRNHFK